MKTDVAPATCPFCTGGGDAPPFASGFPRGLGVARLKPAGLRQGVPKGQRGMILYDKAGMDFDFWKRCRHECAVYFISRVKEGMGYDWSESRVLAPRICAIAA